MISRLFKLLKSALHEILHLASPNKNFHIASVRGSPEEQTYINDHNRTCSFRDIEKVPDEKIQSVSIFFVSVVFKLEICPK